MREKREKHPPQESKKRDYYEVLGVPPSADEAEIKKAYRSMARSIHPDQNPGDSDATANFQELSAAYEVLSDPQRRAAYDKYRHGGDFRVNVADTEEKTRGLARRLEEVLSHCKSRGFYQPTLDIMGWYRDAIKAGIAREKILELSNTEKIQEIKLEFLLNIFRNHILTPDCYDLDGFNNTIKEWQEVGVDFETVLKSGHPKILEKIKEHALSLLRVLEDETPVPEYYLQVVHNWKRNHGIDVSDIILSPEIRDQIEYFLLELKLRPWRWCGTEYDDYVRAWLAAGWQPTEDMSVKELQLLNQEERKEEREQDRQFYENIERFRSIEVKANAGKDLSREDVVFLHDIPVFCRRVPVGWREPILHRYASDPLKWNVWRGDTHWPSDSIFQQIKEFYAKRGVEEMRRDAAIFYGCSVKEVAIDRKTVNKKTKVYVGDLFDGFFDKLAHVQHIYTSFPYSKVVRDTVVLNTPISQIEAELGRLGVGVSPRASELLESLKKEGNAMQLGEQEFTLISVRESDFLRAQAKYFGREPHPPVVGLLNFVQLYIPSAQQSDFLLARTKRFGLEPCPPLVGLQYFVALFKTPGHWLLKNDLSLFVEPSMRVNGYKFSIQNRKDSFGRVGFKEFWLHNEFYPVNGRYGDAQRVFLKSKKPEKNWMLKLLGL